MRLYAPLLFALFVLRARAATIPERLASEIEKKIPTDEENKTQDNNTSEQELIDQANNVKDVENNLRNKPVEGIPVTVIIDDDDVKLKAGNEVEEDIVRPQADLRNPGPPQRQEHETQNPEYYDDSRRTVTNFEKTIQDSKIILKQGFQGVSNDIQSWVENHEQMSDIQQSIKNLQDSFTVQLKKLNETIKTILNKHAGDGPISDDQANSLRSIKSELGYLEENFSTGLKTLAEGVQVIATLRADTDAAASSESGSAAAANPAPANPEPAQPVNPSPAPPAATTEPANTNPLATYLNQLQTMFTNSFTNISQSLSNFINQNQAGANQASSSTPTPAAAQGTQADEQAANEPPSIWAGIQNSINNLNPFNNIAAQSQQAAQGQNPSTTPSGPFGQINQAFQSNPIVQQVVGFLQGNRGQQTTQAPAQAVQPAAQAVQPVAQAAQSVEPQKAPEPQPTPGPIRQIIQNSPIVQGLTNTVQRIQGSINNPETPRDALDMEEGDKEITTVPLKGHGGGSGNNNNVDGGVSEASSEKEEIIEEKIEEILPVEPKKDDLREPEKVADKTE